MTKFILLNILLFFIISCNSHKQRNEKTNEIDWINFTDTIYNFSIKIPSNFVDNYSIIFYKHRIFQPDTTSKEYWNVERFHSKMYYSLLNSMISAYDSSTANFNGNNVVVYTYNEPNRPYHYIAKAVKYTFGDFIYEVSTHIDNDTLFDKFCAYLTVDTFALRNSFNDMKQRINRCKKTPNDSPIKQLSIDYIMEEELSLQKESHFKIKISGYNKDKYMIRRSVENAIYKWNFETNELTITPKLLDSVRIEIGFIDKYWGLGLTVQDTCIGVNN